ncbi:hypothetical protein [Caudovirus D_HF2_7]|jgi:hypothetical protein|nr:hypothetical protein [Caudovirus D_HF2_7]DAV28626.1 MAG TPA: hypothetical protein [Caudoviricetes sp.]
MATKKADKLPEFTSLDGHELLVSPHAIRPSKRMRLTAVLAPLMDEDPDSVNLLEVLADVMEALEDGGFIKDLEAWDEFYDKSDLEAIVNLVMAYAGEAAGAKG